MYTESYEKDIKIMRKALTIGELLITMTIIGVIAILVIPGFLKDYHHKVYTTKLKKAYGLLSNAMEQACIDNNVSYFNQTPYSKGGAIDKQQEFLDNYFKVSQKNAGSAFADTYRTITGVNNEGASITTYLNGTAKSKLQGGEALALFCETTVDECVVMIDINGKDGPNIGGRDLFRFRLDTKKNIVMSHSSVNECGTDQYGHGCLNRLLKDNWIMKY